MKNKLKDYDSFMLYIIFLAIISVTIFSIDHYFFQNSHSEKKVESKSLYDEYLEKEKPYFETYDFYESRKQENEKSFKADIHFSAEDTTVMKTFYFYEEGKDSYVKKEGLAKYSFDGSIIKYEPMMGDEDIFPEKGEIMEEVDKDSFILHTEDGNKYTFKKARFGKDKN